MSPVRNSIAVGLWKSALGTERSGNPSSPLSEDEKEPGASFEVLQIPLEPSRRLRRDFLPMAGGKSSNGVDDEQLAISEGVPSKTAPLSLPMLSSESELRRKSSSFSEKRFLLLLVSWERDSDELGTPNNDPV